jgi:hypothetical protein
MADSSNLLFYRPNDIIDSDNSSPNMIKIPWGIDFFNYNTIKNQAANVEDLGDRITALESTASNPPIQTTTSIFHQSISNHTAMFTTCNGVYATVTSNNTFPTTIKTTVRDTDPIIYPRTTNTLITMYYSSYVDN